MTIQDQISDMITRIRNSVMVKHEKVSVGKSKLNLSILQLLNNEGFISDFAEEKSDKFSNYSIKLKYFDDGSSAISGVKQGSSLGCKLHPVCIATCMQPALFSGSGYNQFALQNAIFI